MGDHRIAIRRRRTPRTFAGRAVGAAALLLTLVVSAVCSTAGAGPVARAARTISISDSARLHLTSHHGFTLNEQGTAIGHDHRARSTSTSHVVSTNHVTAEVNIYPQRRLAHRQRHRQLPPVRRGRELQRHDAHRPRHRQLQPRARHRASASPAPIQRSNDAVTVHVSGRMST